MKHEVHTIYHDSDGSVYCYDTQGNYIKYPQIGPTGWPERIGDVKVFCENRGIIYKSG